VLSDYLWQSGILVNGVNSSRKVAKQFSAIWTDRATLTSKIKMEEMIYRLDQVIFPEMPDGLFRKATLTDFQLLANWMPAFHLEALNEPLPPDEINHLKERIQSQSVFVWEKEAVVSVAMKTRETENGATIGFVYTPPELRGNGYAKAVVASLSQHLLDIGFKFCSLYTNLANKTSNFIYQKIGYMPIFEAVDIRFSKEIT
jgi:predicted GNAT family acetyltransferase